MKHSNKRRKKKGNSGMKWKLLILTVIILGTGAYYIYSSNGMRVELPDKSDIQQTLEKTAHEADKLKDEIISKAENIKPIVEKIRTGNDTETSTVEAPKLNLEIPVYTYPGRYKKEIVLYRTGYTVSYNEYYKNPNWVAWELTREETKGETGKDTTNSCLTLTCLNQEWYTKTIPKADMTGGIWLRQQI